MHAQPCPIQPEQQQTPPGNQSEPSTGHTVLHLHNLPKQAGGVCVCVCVWSQRSVFTYRKSHLTQLVHPVVQLLQVCSEQVDLLRGLDEEGSRVSGTSVQLHLGHADAVGQPDHLEAARR